MNIGIIGVGRSRNVGDQLIAASIQATIHSLNEKHQVQIFDFDFGEFSFSERITHPPRRNKIRKRLPKPNGYWIRAIKNFFSFLFDKTKRKRLSSFIAKQDVVLVGGGHLLIDNYLAFALQIFNISSSAQGRPIYFWCVGSSEKKSWLAKILFQRALSGCIVYTRDTLSTENLRNQSICTVENSITLCDAAIFCDYIIPAHNNPHSSPLPIGLAIMDPQEAHRHSDIRTTREQAALFWLEVANRLAKIAPVKILNNGNDADQYFIDHYIRPALPSNSFVCPQVSDYREMLMNMATCSRVLSQRLHATLPCLAFSIPFLAIYWDKKLSGILTDLMLADHLVSFLDSPESVVSKLMLKTISEDSKQSIDAARARYQDALKAIL